MEGKFNVRLIINDYIVPCKNIMILIKELCNIIIFKYKQGAVRKSKIYKKEVSNKNIKISQINIKKIINNYRQK